MKMVMWLVVAACLVGTVANIYKKSWCFIVWTVTNVIWVVHNYMIEEYAQGSLFVIHAVLAIWGLIQWTRVRKKGIR